MTDDEKKLLNELLELLDAAAGELCRMHRHVSPDCVRCSTLDLVERIRAVERKNGIGC